MILTKVSSKEGGYITSVYQGSGSKAAIWCVKNRVDLLFLTTIFYSPTDCSHSVRYDKTLTQTLAD